MSAILSQMFLLLWSLSSYPRAHYLLSAVARYIQAVSLVMLLSPLPHTGLYPTDLVVFLLVVMVDFVYPISLT